MKRNILIFVQRNVSLLLVVALAFLTSVNSLTNGFAYDDTWMFVDNSFMHSPRNLPAVFFTNPWTPNDVATVIFPYYRPFIASIHIVEYYLFGTKAGAYHLVNVIIHALVTGLVFDVFRKITDCPRVVFIAAALFAVHPVHAESVAWVSGIPDLLIALFALIIVRIYLAYRQGNQWRYVTLMTALFLLALLSKETALIILPIILFVEIYLGKCGGQRSFSFRRVFAVASAFTIPVCAYLILRFYANGGILFEMQPRYPPTIVFFTIPKIILNYIELLVVPTGYSIHHFVRPEENVSFTTFVAPLLVIAVGAILVVLSRSRLLVFSAAWFAVWLLPALIAVGGFPSVVFVQERYLYLPSIGFCLAVAVGFDWIYRNLESSLWAVRTTRIAFILLIAALAFVHARQNLVWHDTISLMTHNIRVNDSLPEAYCALAFEYMTRKRFHEAEESASLARQTGPNNLEAYIVSGAVARRTGDLDRAVRYLEHAETLTREGFNPVMQVMNVYLYFGRTYVGQNDLAKAEYNFRKAVEIGNNVYGWDELAQFYYDQGRFAESLDCFKQVELRAAPTTGYVHLKLGRVYDKLRQPNQAREKYETYLRLAPKGRHRKEAQARLESLADGGA